MKNLIIFLITLLIAVPLWAQDDRPELAVSNIADSMKADAVIRSGRFELRLGASSNGMNVRLKKVVTVFGKKGLNYASELIEKSKYTNINYMRGKIYDEHGKFLRKLEENEIVKTDFDGSAFIDDVTQRVIFTRHREFPFTMEIEYSIDEKYASNIPSWAPFETKASVEKAEFMIYGSSGSFRYKSYNIPEPEGGVQKGSKYYKWEVNNLKPYKPLSFMPPGEYDFPYVKVATKRIRMGERTWSANSWEDIGKWYYELNKDRAQFSKKQVKAIQERVSGLSSPKEKALHLFSYMQENMRYVLITLGIGGHLARTATEVEENGYGDCKALTNYLYNCLKINGVESYPVLVNAGEGNNTFVSEDFPSTSFNHVFLMVPTSSDTLWIECTDSNFPAAYNSSFTDDRFVLQTAPDGGKLLRTPAMNSEDNVLSREVRVKINPDGSGEGTATGTHKGFFYGDARGLKESVSEERLYKIIRRYAEVTDFKIKDIRFEDDMKPPHECTQSIDFTARRFGKKSGSRVFLKPWLFEDELIDLDEKFEDRTYDFYLKRGKKISEDYEFELPARMTVEHLPEPVKKTFDFGVYERSFIEKDGKLIVKRVLALKEGRYKAEVGKQFAELRELLNEQSSEFVILKSEF